MSDRRSKVCIYPGCQRPAVPPHVLGGPQPSFCDLDEHNALSAHQERQRLAREGGAAADYGSIGLQSKTVSGGGSRDGQ
jgi:hypothetical protein